MPPIDPFAEMELERKRRAVEADKHHKMLRSEFERRMRGRVPSAYRGGKTLPLVLHPDARLAQKCVEVTDFDRELRDLVTDMTFTMYLCGGVGLAAPQIGVHRRLFVTDWGEKAGVPETFINPRVMTSDGSARLPEACLSFPGARIQITRAERVTVSYQDVKGGAHVYELTGWPARIFQHELDHLDGVVMLARVSKLEKRMALKKVAKIARGERA